MMCTLRSNCLVITLRGSINNEVTNKAQGLTRLSWVSKMVIPVYGVSEGEALCDWIY